MTAEARAALVALKAEPFTTRYYFGSVADAENLAAEMGLEVDVSITTRRGVCSVRIKTDTAEMRRQAEALMAYVSSRQSEARAQLPCSTPGREVAIIATILVIPVALLVAGVAHVVGWLP